VPKHVTPPPLSAVLISHHSAVTANPRTGDFSWAPDGLQSDIDTDRVMFNIDTGILITSPD
jgi:hypothetical protein